MYVQQLLFFVCEVIAHYRVNQQIIFIDQGPASALLCENQFIGAVISGTRNGILSCPCSDKLLTIRLPAGKKTNERDYDAK
jgi:hypothetical protein